MLLLFILLCSIIGGYWFITDSQRVQEMAESYFSNLIGGQVTVGDVRLGIFEGLQVDDVRISTPRSDDPDRLLFRADSFRVKYSLRSLIRGRLEATQIIAINPRVYLTEDVDNGQWNYQRLSRSKAPSMPGPSEGLLTTAAMPEVLLRNAQFIYSELHQRQLIQRGVMNIEGRFWQGTGPAVGQYNFELQSRGETEGVGAVASGSVSLSTGQVNMRMSGFRFGSDIRSLLVAEVRQFWQQHQLQGHLEVPEFTFTPPRNGHKASFRIRTDLDDVTLVIHAQEFNSQAENQRLEKIRRSLELMGQAGLDGGGLIDPFNHMFNPAPIKLDAVAGTFIFTQDGVEIKKITGRLESNVFTGSGKIQGYDSDAPGYMEIHTPADQNIHIPQNPSYVNSLPPQVREIYDRFRPVGTARLSIELRRDQRGAQPHVYSEIEILDGQFTFDHFPYPVRNATGRLILGDDPHTGRERLDIKNLRGRGAAGSPNADSVIHVNGYITPFGPTAGVHVVVSGEEISSDLLLRQAFPPETRQALHMLDPTGVGDSPKFKGSFSCQVIRPEGYHTQWQINTDIRLDDASGALIAFPYPLEHVTALLKVRSGYVQIIDAAMTDGPATLLLNGTVRFGDDEPVSPDLQIVARNVPVDGKLLSSLPPQWQGWLKAIALKGVIDVDGRIYGQFHGDAQAPVQSPSTVNGDAGQTRAGQQKVSLDVATGRWSPEGQQDQVMLDLVLNLRDGSAWDMDGVPTLTGLSGRMHLGSDRLDILNLTGHRGNAQVSADGAVQWDHDQPRVKLAIRAADLQLDQSLYKLLPRDAQESWQGLDPHGSVDVHVQYEGRLEDASTDENHDKDHLQTLGRSSQGTPAYTVQITPRQLSVKSDVFPYQLDHLTGIITVTPDTVRLEGLHAEHGATRINIDGTGRLGTQNQWDLQLNARQLMVDQPLLDALPQTLAQLISNVELTGTLDVDLTRLRVKARPTARLASDTPAALATTTTRPSDLAEVDFSAVVHTSDAALSAGVPLTKVTGQIQLAGTVHDDRIEQLQGSVNLDTLQIAGRNASALEATIDKSADSPVLSLKDLKVRLAGGDMVGQAEWALFDQIGASSYNLSLLLRGASVRELAGELDPGLNGQVTASLSLSGQWDDPESRRGRGNVQASGKDMYRIPVLLGLLEIANLSLPINSPFNDASVQYMLQGSKVTLEQIRLKSANMLMNGTGILDFTSRQVRMTFTTQNPVWQNVPILGDLLQGARDELLQIQVRGTIEQPKVSASSLNTFTTTVDEVFRDNRK